MRAELLKEIIHSIIGEKSKGIVDLLSVKKNVNEFIIAKKLNLTINQTRNLLYKLSDEGLVSVIRKKNKKKGGWYDHFWTLNLEKTLLKYKETLLNKIEEGRRSAQTKRDTRFYFCETCEIELNEEQALLQEYTCTECGTLLILKDNTKDIASHEKENAGYEKELVEVEAELSIILGKEAKLKVRRIRAEEVKKANEKAAKKEARKKAAKESKSAGIVKVSKKPSKK